jgi:hypothetical protein
LHQKVKVRAAASFLEWNKERLVCITIYWPGVSDTDDEKKEIAKNENGHRDDETGIEELCCQLQFSLDCPRVCVGAQCSALRACSYAFAMVGFILTDMRHTHLLAS